MSAFWATRSLELNRRFLTRIYVPRVLVLVSALSVSGALFLVYVIMTLLAFATYLAVEGHLYLELGPELLIALAGLVLSAAVALSIGLFTSVLSVQARDVRFALRYLLGFWAYLTPIYYSLDTVPSGLRTVTG